MAIRFYDEALLAKIKGWVLDNKMTITGVDETRRLFEYKADVTDDNPISLPLITLRRLSPVTISNINKRGLTYDGMRLRSSDNFSSQINAIPVSIDYQIDIYTRYLDEGDEYVRNFVFNLINYPKVKILVPYNDANYEHWSSIKLKSDIQDNSDIPERLIPGQFTRFSLGITIDDAYLFSVPIRRNIEIEKEIEITLKENK